MATPITPGYAVAVLNGALKTDRTAVSRLIILGVPCNDAMAADPMIPTTNAADVGAHQVAILSALGLITAVFGPTSSGRGYIGVLAGAGGIVRFVELDNDGRVL